LKRFYEKSEDMIRFERIYKNNESLDKIEEEIINRGTPLIQTYDIKHNLITFIFLGDDSCNSVLVLPPLGMGNFDENQMERFFNTNIWYASYLVRNDVRFGYYFSPNDPLDQDWEKRYKRLIRDKNNLTYTSFKGESGEKNILRSDVIQINSEKHIWTSTLEKVKKGQISNHMIKSDVLNEDRTFSIYLPAG